MVLTNICKREDLFPFESSDIPDIFVQKAKKELFETEESTQSSLKELRDLITSEKNLHCRTSDEFLIQFLRARKFDVSKAFSLLKKYTHFKIKYKVYFTGIEYDNILKLIKSNTLRFLPERCLDGCAIIVLHLDNWEPSDVPIHELIQGIALFLYHSINDPVTQINGYKVLLDVKSRPFKHLRFCTPHNIYLLYSGTQECFPGRFKGIHIINMSMTFKTAWTLIHPFLSEKLKSRIIFHQNNDTLLDYFPKCLLPSEFGGQLEDYDTTPWLKNVFQEDNLEKLSN